MAPSTLMADQFAQIASPFDLPGDGALRPVAEIEGLMKKAGILQALGR